MRRLPMLLSIAGLAVAVWAVPSLAASHKGHTKSASRAGYGATAGTMPRTTKRTSSAGRTAVTADLLHSSLAPSVPSDPMIDGASPGRLPWVLKSGQVTVSGGHIRADLDGFLIPGSGVGPVKTVSASLYCDGSTKPAASTPDAKLSSSGHASIDAAVMLPKSCLAPVVLVHPNGQAGSYVAASGWMR